jgi:hypothetical protein
MVSPTNSAKNIDLSTELSTHCTAKQNSGKPDNAKNYQCARIPFTQSKLMPFNPMFIWTGKSPHSHRTSNLFSP